MKKILLPTDFSENSFNAISYALQLYRQEECLFYLLNTYTPVLYDNEYLVYNAAQPTLTELYKKKSQDGLERILKRIEEKYQNPLHTFEKISSFNLLNDEIKEIVREKEIDLVVMGTKGATGAEEILFGTHTVHAIEKTKCPLLAIPSHFSFRKPKEVLFPTDYQFVSTEDLKILKDISSKYKSLLHILHVYFGVPLNEEQESKKKMLAETFKNNGHHFYSNSEKSVPQAIYDFQEENEVDLLVMINNKHSFFENLLFEPVINEIGFHVRVPFLVIPSRRKAHR